MYPEHLSYNIIIINGTYNQFVQNGNMKNKHRNINYATQ